MEKINQEPEQYFVAVDKVKDAIGFLLSCAYPEMIASEHNRNREVLAEICKLIDTLPISLAQRDKEVAAKAFDAGQEHGIDIVKSTEWAEDTTTPDKYQYIKSL